MGTPISDMSQEELDTHAERFLALNEVQRNRLSESMRHASEAAQLKFIQLCQHVEEYIVSDRRRAGSSGSERGPRTT